MFWFHHQVELHERLNIAIHTRNSVWTHCCYSCNQWVREQNRLAEFHVAYRSFRVWSPRSGFHSQLLRLPEKFLSRSNPCVITSDKYRPQLTNCMSWRWRIGLGVRRPMRLLKDSSAATRCRLSWSQPRRNDSQVLCNRNSPYFLWSSRCSI